MGFFFLGGGGVITVVPLLFVNPKTQKNFVVALIHCTC